MWMMEQDWTSRPRTSGTTAGAAHFRCKSIQLIRTLQQQDNDGRIVPHALEKRRAYERRVIEVEHGSFTPIVLSTSGGWGPSTTVAFRRLAGLLSDKHAQPYSTTLGIIRCKITFSLLHSIIMCMRGARSSLHSPALDKIGDND